MWVYIVPSGCSLVGLLIILISVILFSEYSADLISVGALFILSSIAIFIILDLISYRKNKNYFYRKLLFFLTAGILCFLNTKLFQMVIPSVYHIHSFFHFYLNIPRILQLAVIGFYIYIRIHFKEKLTLTQNDSYDERMPLWIFLLSLYTVFWFFIIIHIPQIQLWFNNLSNQMYENITFKILLKESWKFLILYVSFTWFLLLLNIKNKHTFTNTLALGLIPCIIILDFSIFNEGIIQNFLYKKEANTINIKTFFEMLKYFLSNFDFEILIPYGILVIIVLIIPAIIGITNSIKIKRYKA